MSDQQSDFERLIGPDRRRIPRPRGLAALVAIIALAILVGLIVVYPRDVPVLDLTTFGFADDVVRATVSDTLDLPCSYAPELECHLAEFSFEGQSIVQEFAKDIGLLQIPEFDLGGLLLAGIVLGAIGAMDDVTVTQA